MRRPISTRTHGILDYLTVGTFIALPRIMGFSDRLTKAMTTLALGKLGYVLFTRHELAAFKLIPMKAHLMMDAVGGAGLAALPWMVGEDDDVARTTCAALGAMDIAIAPMTQTEPSFARRAQPRKRTGQRQRGTRAPSARRKVQHSDAAR